MNSISKSQIFKSPSKNKLNQEFVDFNDRDSNFEEAKEFNQKNSSKLQINLDYINA